MLSFLTFFVSCKEEENPDQVRTSGCDGNPNSTNCKFFFVGEDEVLTYPSPTSIQVTEGVEINGTVLVEGDFSITAAQDDIIINGKILPADSSNYESTNSGRKASPSKNQRKADTSLDGFTTTITANNGNIILNKGATIFSGRGQDALPEEVQVHTISGYYEGTSGGNGGLIILNAPNGHLKLPALGNSGNPNTDELFVLGNGGRGASVSMAIDLEVQGIDKFEVRGGLGGNSGSLVIDVVEVRGMPTMEEMKDRNFIFGGKGGAGGGVSWNRGGYDDLRTFKLYEIILHGGDGGDGARYGGNGGPAYFVYPETAGDEEPAPFSKIGDPVADAYCYGGDGGNVFPSPLPASYVKGGDGGGFIVLGATGWSGGETDDGTLHKDGAQGGDAFGQGGNGGDVETGVNAYEAWGGHGGFAEGDLPPSDPDEDFAKVFFQVKGGDGGTGYDDCSCPGGNGGNSGKASAYGGKGGDVFAKAKLSFGGDGGNTWSAARGRPGKGGSGNPPGKAGRKPSSFIVMTPGQGGNGDTPGIPGDILGVDDLLAEVPDPTDGELCGVKSDECNEEPDSLGTIHCWDEANRRPVTGSSFVATYESGIGTSVVEKETVTGTYVESEGTFGWWYESTFVRTFLNSEEPPQVATSNGWLNLTYPPDALDKSWRARCVDGAYIPPGSGSCCEGTQSWTISGCNPFDPQNINRCGKCEFDESIQRWRIAPGNCGD